MSYDFNKAPSLPSQLQKIVLCKKEQRRTWLGKDVWGEGIENKEQDNTWAMREIDNSRWKLFEIPESVPQRLYFQNPHLLWVHRKRHILVHMRTMTAKPWGCLTFPFDYNGNNTSFLSRSNSIASVTQLKWSQLLTFGVINVRTGKHKVQVVNKVTFKHFENYSNEKWLKMADHGGWTSNGLESKETQIVA